MGLSTNAATDERLWRYATAGQVTSSPTVVNGALYFGSEDDHVYAFALP
jgi:outer membrane protein assembly factor BamB